MFDLSKKDPAHSGSGSLSSQDRSQQGASGTSSGANRSSGSGNAVIGRSIKIVGDLRGEEDLRIEGDIDGTIHLPNHSLTIGTEGRINADAYAKSVTIDGEMNGDVYGSECVTVRANARVAGNIVASRVSLEEGARFKGSIDMDPKSVKAALDKVQGAQTPRAEAPRANGSSTSAGSIAEPAAAKPAVATSATAESARR
jgi:cytoskeletal protein CcmA (bactofilin family)